MQCEQAKDILARQLDEPLDLESESQLRHHLSTCPSCRSDQLALDVLQSRLNKWKDLKPPRWERVPFMQPRSRWRTWVPVAVAAMLMLVVFMKTQIHVQSGGILISIGDADQAEEIAELETRFYQTLNDIQASQSRQYQAILSNLDDLDAKNRSLVVGTLDLQRKDQAQAMDNLISALQNQRQKDLTLLTENIDALHKNQKRTRTDLVGLAQYVQNTPRKRS